jgi:biotin-dependent carboxylase-like uncharacterized protein
MKLVVGNPGMLTTVQDLGRWGYQQAGMPVAGAMDADALRIGNILVCNDEGAAGLEITLLGPSLTVDGDGLVAVAGADLGFRINGGPAPCWTALKVTTGDRISFSGPAGAGARAYLCVAGGIDVPLVMGSRSTYLRAALGGFGGRALKTGDRLESGALPVLWKRAEGFACPDDLRPCRDMNVPLRVVPGPQDDLFTQEGIDTFYGSEYTITNSADRMGYRMEGPAVAHTGAPDIVSDAIPLGAVQIPGHGQPIAMLADRQTTGGYTKIGVLCTPDIASLAQRLPGQKVRFRRVTFGEALSISRAERERIALVRQARALRTTRPDDAPHAGGSPEERLLATQRLSSTGSLKLVVDGTAYNVTWETASE